MNFEHLICLLNNTDMEIGNEQDKILEFVLKLQSEQQSNQELQNKLDYLIDNCIKSSNSEIIPRCAKDAETAKQIEQLVKFQLDKMFTAVEDLKAEQQAHNALREKLKELEWSNRGMCPCCKEVKYHDKNCWLNTELQAIKEE